jgi:hypothetical protein
MCIVSCDHLEAVFSGTINDNVLDDVYWSCSRIRLKIRVGKHKAFQAAVVAIVRSEELVVISFHVDFEVMTTSKRIEHKLSSDTSHSHHRTKFIAPWESRDLCQEFKECTAPALNVAIRLEPVRNSCLHAPIDVATSRA